MKPRITTQFKRDVKRAKRQNKDLSLLKTATDTLLEGKQLPKEYREPLTIQFLLRPDIFPTEQRRQNTGISTNMPGFWLLVSQKNLEPRDESNY